MSRDSSSPPPMSDDSAVGSMNSATINNNIPKGVPICPTQNGISNSIDHRTLKNPNPPDSRLSHPQRQNNLSHPINISIQSSQVFSNQQIDNNQNQHHHHAASSLSLIRPEELRMTASRMRYNNTTLTSRSIRTNLSCFNDLDIQRFDSSSDYIVNFISIGINKSQHQIHRPVSIIWPDTYDTMIDELAKLDAYLINTEYKEKPIDWMIARGLTIPPECRQCKEKMDLSHDSEGVKWRCQKTPTCQNVYAPVLRPSAFRGFENVGLMKLLFSTYYWATCTQSDLIIGQLRLSTDELYGIWKNLQNICRIALEKSYPRFRLCNSPNSGGDLSSLSSAEPIDLVSIKFNGNFIVCAKHPKSNCVRLGLWIPKVSQYTFAQLTESWFAHGSHLRICENKFTDLKKLRTDLKIDLVNRFQMVTKDKSFNRDSAFGYLVSQLTHIFKDFDSSAVTRESLKLILAELEWRELYGTNPFDAFSKIIEHMSVYRNSTDSYDEETVTPAGLQPVNCSDNPDYIYAEKYFYATLHPTDEKGNIIQKFCQQSQSDELPAPIVQFRCHICKFRYESFYFSMHLVAHVEKNRKEDEETLFAKSKKIKCKHCFRLFTKKEIIHHSRIFQTDYQNTNFSCRICCYKFGNRAKFLDHMRRHHFEHEMPYRCPKCRFASSFQRELYIHFQEEHQQEFVILCPFCSRSFTVADSSKMDDTILDEISRQVYNHISSHYLLANSYACDNCCLTFLDKNTLLKRKKRHHNALELFPKTTKLQPFIVTRAEENFCVQAIPLELFIPNKQPNVSIEENSQQAIAKTSKVQLHKGRSDGNMDDNNTDVNGDNMSDISDVSGLEGPANKKAKKTKNKSVASQHESSNSTVGKFLAGGEASMRVACRSSSLTTESIIGMMSKFKKADCIIPNQAVIVHPIGGALKCIECFEHMTVDHLVSTLHCRPCKFSTHCPRALTKHKLKFHSDQ